MRDELLQDVIAAFEQLELSFERAINELVSIDPYNPDIVTLSRARLQAQQGAELARHAIMGRRK